jgi:hypothetical protein
MLRFSNITIRSKIGLPGSLRPLRTVRAIFTAYGSSTFKAFPMKGYPAVRIVIRYTKISDLFTL